MRCWVWHASREQDPVNSLAYSGTTVTPRLVNKGISAVGGEMLSAPLTASRNNGISLPGHSDINSNEWRKKRIMFIVLDVSTLVLFCSHVCLFVSRRCSSAEGCGQSSGAIQTNRHALRSLLPQTQGLQRREGGAAVRQLGWPGLCRKHPALSHLKRTASHHCTFCYTYMHTFQQCLFLYVGVSPHILWKCFLLPPPVASPCWINSVATHYLFYVFNHSPTGLIISDVSFTFIFLN